MIDLDHIYGAGKPRGDPRQQFIKMEEEENLKGVSFGPDPSV